MKTYTYEELCAYVEQQLADNQGILYYRPRASETMHTRPFIMLNEPICYEPYWRGGPLIFQKGDYLHADPHDVYGLTAEAFARCYMPVTTV